jgi:catechol 2,3-dioxygenase-like lactoylglutathione lyase family enzyme
MNIEQLDHLVLTVADIDKTIDFYTRVMGMKVIISGDNRKALCFGQQKINLHLAGHEIEPKANKPTPGSADLCFITSTPIDDILQHLKTCHVEPLMPPGTRTGATHRLLSIYFRDSDNNLIEVSNRILDEIAT